MLVAALLLLAGALGLTAFRLDAALARRDGERIFWVGFTGFLASLLALVWAVTESPAAAPWVSAGTVAVAGGAAVWLVRRARTRREAKRAAESRQRAQPLTRRHDAVLLQWSSYELDPWKAAEKPGLLDVRRPETADFVRAMRTAGNLRPQAAEADLDADLEGYANAVAALEGAWRTAEGTTALPAGGRHGDPEGTVKPRRQ